MTQIISINFHSFGDLPINHSKAKELYKKVIQSGSGNNFYTAHAYFSLGMMNHFGNGIIFFKLLQMLTEITQRL